MTAEEIKTGKRQRGGFLMAILVSAGVTAGLLLILALCLASGKLTYELASETVIAVNFIGAAVGGVILGKKRSGGAIISGLIIGVIFMLFLILCGLAAGKGIVSADEGVRIAICSICGGAFGGVLAAGKGNKKLHKKRKRNSR